MSDVVTDQYKLLWAKSKPWHPLWKHLLDAAAVSLALPAPAIGLGWKAEMTAFLVGLHDIGKADPCFQHHIPDFSDKLEKAGYPKTCDSRCRHERISAKFMKNELGKVLDPYTADTVSRAVLAHHGYWYETARGVPQAYQDAQDQLYQMLRRVLGIDTLPEDLPVDLSAFGMRLAGHLVLCDWIASNEKFFADPRLHDIADETAYFAAVKEVATRWVHDLGLERIDSAGNPSCIVKAARPIQHVLLDTDIPPGLVIIEAPMGEGKTEAAWILAEKWRDHGYHGMYMALPTMATSDSLHNRYQKDYLQKVERGEAAKLVHGMAWLRDDKEPENPPEVGERGDDRTMAAAWFRPTRRAMLAAHGVGTVDQAMLAGMNVKFGFLRLYGLADRVLVIDEVHAYDAYMSAIICRLLNWCACLRIPVILLSATLSAKQRAAMIEAYGATGGDPGPEAPYPLITITEPNKEVCTIPAEASSSRTLKIETHAGLLSADRKTAEKAAGKVAEKAAELVKDGGCCCVILNTVKQAQAVYEALRLPKRNKLLFHARFTAVDRDKITNKVLNLFGKGTANRPEQFVLVATQVVEQSLDVDFDYMISELAPIDLLLQRSGRMHRHRTRDHHPVLHVLLPEDKMLTFGGTGYVYADKPLLRTLAILNGRSEIYLPNDFRLLVERCYGSEELKQDAVPWEALKEADQEWEQETQFMHNQGRQFTLRTPNKRFFQPVSNDPTGDDSDDGNGWRARTRLGANDRTAVLVSQEELGYLAQGELPMKQVRNLYRRSLKLPGYLPVHNPAQGYSTGVEAKGRLRGLVLLPVANDGVWRGMDEKGNCYEVTYHAKLGLMAGRVE
ncbi:MAG: CRISPR-associated helicase Cas3' [Armatimonadota bacterium]